MENKRYFVLTQAVFLTVFGGVLWGRGALPVGMFLLLGLLTLAAGLWPRPVLWVDLLPFAILLLTYQSLRGFVDGLAPGEIHAADIIEWERMLTGGMPAAVWRPAAASVGLAPLLDVAANLAYFSHFLVPIGLCVWLHRFHRGLYWPLLTIFLSLSYAGFLTYVWFPAAPPWWATQEGLLGGAEAVTLEGFLLSPDAMAATPDPLAAVPSMHCAYPLYWALVMSRLKWRRAGWLWLLTATVCLSVVYLGHHYVVDVAAGLAYAGAAFGPAAWVIGGREAAAPGSA